MLGCAAQQTSKDMAATEPSPPYIEIKLTYNVAVYEKPSFFLPESYPTYAIWIEEPNSGEIRTMYVTAKAGQNKWILADSRPESLPVWFGVQKKESAGYSSNVDAVSGATQSGETAVIYWPVPPELLNKQVNIYLEANNSFDYNDYYSKNRTAAGYSGANGQPSLVWKATLALNDTDIEVIESDIIGHGHALGEDHNLYPDVSRITSARETFQYIGISYKTKQ
jgi:hypothetical protein